jgi:hypothetical protein
MKVDHGRPCMHRVQVSASATPSHLFDLKVNFSKEEAWINDKPNEPLANLKMSVSGDVSKKKEGASETLVSTIEGIKNENEVEFNDGESNTIKRDSDSELTRQKELAKMTEIEQKTNDVTSVNADLSSSPQVSSRTSLRYCSM